MSLRITAVAVVACVPVLATLLVLVAGLEGAWLGGLPVFAWCIGGIFALQWLMFIHAHLRQTERFFDLTGGITFAAVVVFAAAMAAGEDLRSLALAGMVLLWAGRLATFLFIRVSRVGQDARFAKILPNFWVHLMTWTLQGIWVAMTISCALVAMTSVDKAPPDIFLALGGLLWLLGFLLEVIADRQKTNFRRDPANQGRFITTGLWAWSRHPNYLGEILLWLGVALVALPVLQGWQHLALLSPLYVCIQLTKISGVDMLERRSDKTWAEEPEYLAYKARTPKLIPWTKAG